MLTLGTLFNECMQVRPLLIRYGDLVPLLLLQSHAGDGVLPDVAHPAVNIMHEFYVGYLLCLY